jgi:opacity protein-like surface antigen
MKRTIMTAVATLLCSVAIHAQEWGEKNHVYFGYTTQTGNFSPNGLEGGLDWRLKRNFALVVEGSFLGAKERNNDADTDLPIIGVTNIRIDADAWNIQGGGRFFFNKAFRSPKFIPFAHLLYGVSHESTDIEFVGSDFNIGSASDTNWSWSLGVGADYWFNKKWAVRGKVDWLKTHFRDEGQSKARFAFEANYNF